MTKQSAMTWRAQQIPGDWAAQTTADFTVDATWQFIVSADVQGEAVNPKFLLIDNTANTVALTLTLSSITFRIPAATARTFNYPDGLKTFSVAADSATGSATVLVSEKRFVDDISNQTAAVTPPSGSSGMKPHITVKTSGTTFITNAACTYATVEVIGAGNDGGTSLAATAGAGGGGGGGYAKKNYILIGSTTYTIAVGIVAGASSTFTDGVTLLTGSGGAVGGTGSGTAGGAGGAGGTGTNGDINLSGGSGSGGGSGNTNDGAGGIGGMSGSGLGAGGAGARGSSVSNAGGAGALYGGGGGGSSAGGAAGPFGQGAVIITEWY